MTDITETIELVNKAYDLKLDGRDFLDEFDIKEVAAEYNGIGPAWMEDELRWKVTGFLYTFAPAAVIHDLRNARSDGTRFAFMYANYEFFFNCLKCIRAKYSWWNWRRYRGITAAFAMYDFVSGSGGWKAWMDCYEKNQTTNQGE